MGDYFFSKKGWVYGYLANSFKELVLTFDGWFSKIIKLVWPLIKVLMNQKTYLEPLIFYTKFFMKTINYSFFSQSLELKVQWFWNQNQTKNGGY